MKVFIPTILLITASFANAQQTYPNIEGEILLEDDRVIVQRFTLDPGQWEGIHEHPEYQLVVVLKSTDELTSRFRGTERVFPGPENAEADSIEAFWRQGPIAISDQHESGNTGTRPLEWISISFKSESIATDDPPVQIVEQ